MPITRKLFARLTEYDLWHRRRLAWPRPKALSSCPSRRRLNSFPCASAFIDAAAQEIPIGRRTCQPQCFLPGSHGGVMSAEAEFELADDGMPSGIAGRHILLRNGSEAV